MSLLIRVTRDESEEVGRFGDFALIKHSIRFTAAGENETFLSVTTAAEVMGVSRAAVRRMIAREQLPAEKFGGRWRIRSLDVSRVAKQLPR